jgi:hypothetical protein
VTALNGNDSNDGAAFIVAPEPIPDLAELAAAVTKKPNGMQQALATAAMLLPTAGANVAAHTQRIANVPETAAAQPTVAHAIVDIVTHLKASFGTP